MSRMASKPTGRAASRAARPQEVVERALSLSAVDGCVVIADESSEANLRWAGNTLTTNGVMRGRRLTVIATVDGTSGVAAGVVSRSNVGLEQVADVVRAAEAAARGARAAEDAQPLVPGAGEDADWDDGPPQTSTAVFADFAPGLGEAMNAAASQGRQLFGFAEHGVTTTYLGSSAGQRRRHVQPKGRVEITAKSGDWSRSTWVGQATRDFRDVEVTALDADLRRRLGWAERSASVGPGRYETILPPTAVADLMLDLYWSAGARDAADGRSVFSRPGGGTRLGERLTDTAIRLYSDPGARGLECARFVVAHASGSTSSVFDNGLAVGRTDWINDGTLSALVGTRHSAEVTGVPVAPEVDNLLLEAPDASKSLEEMVASTRRGLLVTCLWYIRIVDPQTLLVTGLTRDGVYLVERGEVVGVVTNFRFNDSPVDMLGRLVEVGRTERCLPREWADFFSRAAMPALRVADFNMSTVSQAS